MMLAYLLARQGIAVTLLEGQRDFNRKFRGDTLHMNIIENFDQLGLLDKAKALPHTVIQQMVTVANGQRSVTGDLSKLKNKPHPYMMMVAQPLVLQLLADEAAQFDRFNLLMGASAQELIMDGEVVTGLRFRQKGEMCEIRTKLVIGCDGRSSKLRRLAEFELTPTAEPMEALWISIPKSADEQKMVGGAFGVEEGFITHERVDEWHIALPLPKGGYDTYKKQGLDRFKALLQQAKPHMAERIETHVQSWRDVAVLKVQGGRIRRWYKNGLLLIGDAAHVMTPIMGVGINYAMQDAIATANIIGPVLASGKTVGLDQLAKVQQRRQRPVAIMQFIQARVQSALGIPDLDEAGNITNLGGMANSPIQKVPFLGQLGLRMIATGFRPEAVQLN